MLKSIFEEVVVAQPLHWNMHRPIPPLPDTDRRSPQLYVPPRNRQHQRHLAERSRKTSLLRHVCAVSTVAAQAGSALALLAVVRTIAPGARAGAVTASAIFAVRSRRPRPAKTEYRGSQIVINHRCAKRTTVSALRKVRKKKRAATSVKKRGRFACKPATGARFSEAL